MSDAQIVYFPQDEEDPEKMLIYKNGQSVTLDAEELRMVQRALTEKRVFNVMFEMAEASR